jgi:biotin transporter BioY
MVSTVILICVAVLTLYSHLSTEFEYVITTAQTLFCYLKAVGAKDAFRAASSRLSRWTRRVS